MTRDKQTQFVQDLAASVTGAVVKQIERGNVPETWNGIELRELMAEYFKRNTYAMPKKRKSEYNNAVLVNDL